MPYYPQTNGGNKPHGNRAVASKTFCEAFSLLRKHSAQKVELVAMMNHPAMSNLEAESCKESLHKQIEAHAEFIAEILEDIKMMRTGGNILKSAN